MNPDSRSVEPCDIDPSGDGLAPFGRPANAQRLTPDLIAEALAEYDEIWTARSSDDTSMTFTHKGDGEMRVTLWGWDHGRTDDVEVEARTFRIVEVES